jgi:hypothetical protein
MNETRMPGCPGVAPLLVLFAGSAAGQSADGVTPSQLTPTEARAIAQEAYIYGFPLVDNYRIQHAYFQDKANKEFKAPWNTLFNNARPLGTAA